jgi:hypothetical protein
LEALFHVVQCSLTSVGEKHDGTNKDDAKQSDVGEFQVSPRPDEPSLPLFCRCSSPTMPPNRHLLTSLMAGAL